MARQIGPVKARIEYTGITAVTAALRAMPLERAVRAGARLGGWAMNFDRPNRPIALKNLEIAFPEMTPAARLNILRKMYRSWGRVLAEWTHLPELSRANVEQVATYEGKENWDDVEATIARYARIPKAKEDTVILAPDPDAQHGWVMRILGILNGLEFRNINFKR